MSKRLHRQLDEKSLLEPNMQERLLEELVAESEGLFTINGTLADYRIDEPGQIATIRRTGDQYELDLDFSWPEKFDQDKSNQEKRRVRDSLMRAGLARPVNLDHVMSKLRQIDDVIIGIDTNVMLDCIFSAHLLDEIYREKYPNWILIAVPKLVMAEIENKANSKFSGGNHPRIGWPDYQGRIGNRSLQELLTLDSKDQDRPGLSLLTVGDLDNNMADIAQQENWLLDSEIRTQFHEFLSEISFHKGTYFLSQDRVNVMMSGTEGAEGLYLQKPDIDELTIDRLSIEEFGQLVYELCVQFGEVELKQVGEEDITIRLSIFWPGKQVSDWRQSRLRLEQLESPPW